MLLLILGGGLAGLAALHHGAHAHPTDSSFVITSDSYFYGDSPPVYPAPNITGTGKWASAYQKASAMVGKMTLAEKINLTAGISADTKCSGNIPPIPRLGFPGLCVSDAGDGLRSTEFASSWASGISVGASWNRNLSLARGHGMGAEWKKKGVNIMLGPVISPMGRMAEDGRTWEGISIDPYLAGSLVYQTVSGIQAAGVTTSTKHYIANEQETNRNPQGDVASVSSNIDDKTMHELYLWPFQEALLAGSGNIMCSYNRINNSYGCQNSKTLNGLLKTELGFQGFVMTDWGALHGGVAPALSGLDMVMPNAGGYWGPKLVEAVNNGSVPEYRINDMATRIIAQWYQMGQDQGFPTPGIGMPPNLAAPHTPIDARDPATRPTLMAGAVEGHVLVKNVNNALPLKKPKMISVFGYSAKNPDQNDVGSGSPWIGGGESYTPASQLSGSGYGSNGTGIAAIAIKGTLYSGGGSGATSQSLVSSPMDAITQQCWEDYTEMFWDFTNSDPVVPASSDACLVIGNAWSSEGYDRPALRDDYTDALIKNVAGKCANTIVVFQNAGVRLVDQFVEHPNVTALIFAHLPGEYSGKALVSILYGKENPSGRMSYTVPKNESDYGHLLGPVHPEGMFARFPQDNFTEGLLVDYRRFDYMGITPRFEFGFGLSYTTFDYSNLQVQKTNGNMAEYPTGPVVQGGQTDLWDELVHVTATVKNAGAVGGAEVAQLYLAGPGAGKDGVPVKTLRGFEKQYLDAGQSATFSFALTRRDLSTWDVVAQKWRLQRGKYTIMVGSSSRNLPLTATLGI